MKGGDGERAKGEIVAQVKTPPGTARRPVPRTGRGDTLPACTVHRIISPFASRWPRLATQEGLRKFVWPRPGKGRLSRERPRLNLPRRVNRPGVVVRKSAHHCHAVQTDCLGCKSRREIQGEHRPRFSCPPRPLSPSLIGRIAHWSPLVPVQAHLRVLIGRGKDRWGWAADFRACETGPPQPIETMLSRRSLFTAVVVGPSRASGLCRAASTGTLFVVATPLGNTGDLSPRALQVLQTADLIGAEDTRVTKKLILAAGAKQQPRIVSLHEHNHGERAALIAEVLSKGGSVAMVSDAGTPAISDPGAQIVELAQSLGARVTPVPGPCAAAAAMSVAGALAPLGFVFLGFLPRDGAERFSQLAFLATERQRPCILYEAPHRIQETVEDLAKAAEGDRKLTLCRELTKEHEQILTFPSPKDALEALVKGTVPALGEFTLVLHASTSDMTDVDDETSPLALYNELRRRVPRLKSSDAVARVAALAGVKKKELYAAVLEQEATATREGGKAERSKKRQLG